MQHVNVLQVISMLKERLGVKTDKNLPMVDYRYAISSRGGLQGTS